MVRGHCSSSLPAFDTEDRKDNKNLWIDGIAVLTCQYLQTQDIEVEIEVHAGWGNADAIAVVGLPDTVSRKAKTRTRYRRARHRNSGTPTARHPDSPTLCFSQNNPDLLCHRSSKLALRLRGQMNTVNALGRDEFAGI